MPGQKHARRTVQHIERRSALSCAEFPSYRVQHSSTTQFLDRLTSSGSNRQGRSVSGAFSNPGMLIPCKATIICRLESGVGGNFLSKAHSRRGRSAEMGETTERMGDLTPAHVLSWVGAREIHSMVTMRMHSPSFPVNLSF